MKPIRFEAGRTLSKSEKDEVLKSLGDSYKDHNASKVLKGFDRISGDPRYGYEYRPDLMYVSGITGRSIRHYVKLPDGRIAHPTELFPNISKAEIDRYAIEREEAESLKKSRDQSRESRIAASKAEANDKYKAKGRKVEGSYFAQDEAGRIVRVDGTDADDVSYYTAHGFKQITPVVNMAKRNAYAKKLPLPVEWQVRPLSYGGFRWQHRQEEGDDVYDRPFSNESDLEWFLADRYGWKFAKKVLAVLKTSTGDPVGERKRNPRRRGAIGPLAHYEIYRKIGRGEDVMAVVSARSSKDAIAQFHASHPVKSLEASRKAWILKARKLGVVRFENPKTIVYKAEVRDDAFRVYVKGHPHNNSGWVKLNSYSEPIRSTQEAREQAAEFIRQLKLGVISLRNPTGSAADSAKWEKLWSAYIRALIAHDESLSLGRDKRKGARMRLAKTEEAIRKFDRDAWERYVVGRSNPGGVHLPGLPAKAQREYEHILQESRASGRYGKRAKEVAARTVKKQYGKNPYTDLVIKGQAKKVAGGWQIAGSKTGARGRGKVFESGRGSVQVASGVYLDKSSGLVYSKRERNMATRFRDLSIGDRFTFTGRSFFHTATKTSARGYTWTTADGKTHKSRVGSINVEVVRANAAGKHDAYHKAMAADEAWQKELRRVYGSRAGDARYDQRGTSSAKLKKLKAAFIRASAALQRRQNIAGYKDDQGVFHPIRSGMEMSSAGKLRKSKRKYKPSAVGEKRTYAPKRKAKKRATTKKRAGAKKVTTSRKRATKKRATVKRRNPGTCPTCTRPADQPYRQYDARGKCVAGCIDDFHTGHLITPSESSFWHNRPQAKKLRAAQKKRMREMMKGAPRSRAKNPTFEILVKDRFGPGFIHYGYKEAATAAKAKDAAWKEIKSEYLYSKGEPRHKKSQIIARAKNPKVKVTVKTANPRRRTIKRRAIGSVWIETRGTSVGNKYVVLLSTSTNRDLGEQMDESRDKKQAEWLARVLRKRIKSGEIKVNPTRKGMRTRYSLARRHGKEFEGYRPGQGKAYEMHMRSQMRKGRRLSRSHRANPDATSIRKTFAGRVSKNSSLYFPDGTPSGLAKLGKLIKIKTQRGTIALTRNPGEVWLCCDERGKFHLGSTVQAPLYAGAPGDLGEVEMIEYAESKPHLGYGKTIWFHKLGEEGGRKPTLHANGKGELRFKGGDYRITSRGIEN